MPSAGAHADGKGKPMPDETEKTWRVPLRIDFDGTSHVVRPDIPDTIRDWRRVQQVSGSLWLIEMNAQTDVRDLDPGEAADLRAKGGAPSVDAGQERPGLRLGTGF